MNKRSFKHWYEKTFSENSRPKHFDGFAFVSRIHLQALQEVIEGNSTALLRAFHWDSTKQGHCYWILRCVGKEQLSNEDYRWLRGLLKYAEDNVYRH